MTELLFFHSVPQDLLQELQEEFPGVQVRQCASGRELGLLLPRTEVLVSFKVTAEMLDQAPNLRWVQALTTGVDTLPLGRLRERGITVTSTRGIHAGHMSELAIMAMLMLARNMHRVVHNGSRKVWDRKVPQDEIAGKTVGILGLGSIGKEVARKAAFLGMRVVGVKNRPESVDGVDRVYTLDELDQVFAASDYVVNLLPLTEKTRACIGRRQFACLPPGGCFINLGRGGNVDQEAMIQALGEGTIRAALCDVFAEEPLPEDNPLWDMDNVFIMPHIGGESVHYMQKAMPVIKHNLKAYLEGRQQEMMNVYDPKRGY